MAVYFCFSDECGSYSDNMTEKQIKAHPYYVRAVVMIDAAEWRTLNRQFRELKEAHSIPNSREFKWSYLWLMEKTNCAQNDDNLNYFRQHGNRGSYFSFVENAIKLVCGLSFVKIILSYSVNQGEHHKERNLLKFHFQGILQRIEMEIQSGDNLAILIVDPVNTEKNEQFRNLYYSLIDGDDFIKQYSHVKDSLNIENSHQSVGIQIADFISGIFNSVLRKDEKHKFDFATKLFCEYIYPIIRENRGNKYGYGIVEVPHVEAIRTKYRSKIESIVEAYSNEP